MLLLIPYHIRLHVKYRVYPWPFKSTVGSLHAVASLPVTIIISTALSISKKKLKIIEAVKKGDKSHLDVAKEFSVAKSTVRLLCSRKVQLESMQLSLL